LSDTAGTAVTSRTDRLAGRFHAWRAAGRTALIPYVTAGYPSPGDTGSLLDALADAGADLIELGVPFSDPVADGPTIQRSSQHALEHGVTLAWTLDALRAFRARRDTPVILFSYLNPIVGYGVARFIEDAVAAGAEGVLLTDLPVGGDVAIEDALLASPLALIRLVAPTTAPARLLDIARHAQGFLYYVGRMGVTGARTELREDTIAEVAALRSRVDVPVAVGFGIATPEHARRIGAVADGVIVGSALIDALDTGGIAAAAELVAAMRAALDAGNAAPGR
jgi:tryptophan synthase alpha chain